MQSLREGSEAGMSACLRVRPDHPSNKTAPRSCLRSLLPTLISASLLLLPACSDTIDAFFVNPCSRPLTVRTFDQRESEKLLGVTATLPPTAVTKVRNAFTDASGRDWLVAVDESVELQVNGDEWVHSKVLIPASVCP
jgi:hypothetical protein